MKSLAYCFDEYKGRLSSYEVSKITEYSEAFKAKGYAQGEANESAVNKYVQEDLVKRRADITGQLPKPEPGAPRGPGEIIKEVAEAGVAGLDSATKGLLKLFGGASLKSFPGGLDEESYAEAKAYFEDALKQFAVAKKGLKELAQWLLTTFGPDVKAPFMRWVREKKGVKEELDLTPPKEIETPEAGEAEEAKKKKPAKPKKEATPAMVTLQDGQEYPANWTKAGKLSTVEYNNKKYRVRVKGPAYVVKFGDEDEMRVTSVRPKVEKKLQDYGERRWKRSNQVFGEDRTGSIQEDLDESIISNESPSKTIMALLKVTNRAALFTIEPGENAAPGVTRYLATLRKKIGTFLEVQGQRAGGSRRRGYFSKSFKQALINAIDPEKNSANYESNLEQLKNQAASYISMLEVMADATKGAINVQQAHQALMGRLFSVEVVDGYDANRESNWSEMGNVLFDDYADARGVAELASRFLDTQWIPDSNQKIRRDPVNIFDIITDKRWRKGKDISSKQLAKAFGLGSVMYGDWEESPTRQQQTNLTYDSFRDLQEILEMPANAIGLPTSRSDMVLDSDAREQIRKQIEDGTIDEFDYDDTSQFLLGIAFGARGRGGRYAAAYYPGDHTIALTKMQGDGSLAHEFGHALDIGINNLLDQSMQENVNEEYRRYNPIDDLKEAFKTKYKTIEEMRDRADELLRGLDTRTESVKKDRLEATKKYLKESWEKEVSTETRFFRDAKKVDKQEGKIYYQKEEEMFSRTFEIFVSTKLAGQNDFLVNKDWIAPGHIEGVFNWEAGIYGDQEERARFNKLYEQFFNGIEWAADGTPTMKKDYVPVTIQENLEMKKLIDELLEELEARYNALFQGKESKDGLWWYGFQQTMRAPAMQPDGFMAYDDIITFEDFTGDGVGAVGYPEPLHPKLILRHRLKAVNHDVDTNKIYLEERDDGTTKQPGAPGEEELDGRPPEDGETDEAGEGIPPGADTDTGASGEGADHTGRGEGPATPPGPGTRPGDEDTTTDGERDADTTDEFDALPPERIDYFIKPSDNLVNQTPLQMFTNNMAAINTLKAIEAEGRHATYEEQRILVKYTGWGGIPNAVGESYQVPSSWEARAQMLKDAVTPEEFKSLRSTINTAFYTNPSIISSMYRALHKMGFRSGRVLEPSLGIGHFFGMMSDQMRSGSQLIGNDMDIISVKIAKQLYPSASIATSKYEQAPFPEKYFDLVISNIPFGDLVPSDKKYNRLGFVLPDYFIVKSLELTRPGGLVAVITSSKTMDKTSTKARKAISQKADFLGGVRLPNGTFKGTNTNVGTDILFFRKKTVGVGTAIKGLDFVESTETELNFLDSDGQVESQWVGIKGYSESGPANVNTYFLKNPHQVLGTMGQSSGRYGQETHVLGDLETLDEKIKEALEILPENVFTAGQEVTEIDILDRLAKPGEAKDGAFHIDKDGKLYIMDRGKATEYDTSTAVKKLNAKRIKGLIGLRDTVRRLLRAQAKQKPDNVTEKLRSTLNKKYKAFVKEFGYITLKKNIGPYINDPDAGLVLSLEVWDAEKEKPSRLSAVFTENLLRDVLPPTHAQTPEEGLAYSLNFKGRVDLPHIANLTGQSIDDVKATLKGRIYNDPAQGWVTADDYLSGNVREKLKTAEAAATHNDEFKDNVTALKTVLPKDVPYHKIRTQLGMPWIPKRYILEFATELLGGRARGLRVDHITETNQWNVRIAGTSNRDNADDHTTTTQARANQRYVANLHENNNVWGTPRKPLVTKAISAGGRETGTSLLEAVLNNQKIDVREYVLDERGNPMRNEPTEAQRRAGQQGSLMTRTDPVATNAANRMARKVKAEFRGTKNEPGTGWLWRDRSRRERLVRTHNDIYNSYVDRKFDGSHLTFQGKVHDDIIKLRKHQAASVWRFLQHGISYLGHEVGTGKTYTMVAAIMEAKRLGLARKPIFAIRKRQLEQIQADFLRLYPGANIFFADVKSEEARKGKEAKVLAKRERKAMLTKIATNDWDAVIVTHESLNLIPTSHEFEAEMVQTALDELRVALNQANRDGTARYSIKDIESRITKLEAKLNTINARDRYDIPTFEEMGIDMMVVDEAHMFKNVEYQTRQSGIKGLGLPGGSLRAWDMYTKTSYLHQRFGRGIMLASGTPLTNSVAELFTLSRYLQPEALREKHLHNFDAWTSTFGHIETRAEYAPEGGGFKMSTGFERFINIPELMQMVRHRLDIVDFDDIVYKGEPEKIDRLVDMLALDTLTPAQIDTLNNEIGDAIAQTSGDLLEGRSVRRDMTHAEIHRLRKAIKDSRVIRPDLRGGQPELVVVPRNEHVEEYCISIIERATNYRASPRDAFHPNKHGEMVPDNLLKMMSDGRKAAMDMRLIDDNFPDHPDTKTNYAATNILQEYKDNHEAIEIDRESPDYNQDYTEKNGVQLVFADLGVPKGKGVKSVKTGEVDEWGFTTDVDGDLEADGDFNVYDDLKLKLVRGGIPSNQIQFMHDHRTMDKQRKLFSLVNDGKVRVIIGSTPLMGIGVNIQERVVAMHHLDVHWNYANYEQRNGRGLRFGNRIKEIAIFNYGTKQSTDLFMWETVKGKGVVMDQVMSNDPQVREAMDVSQDTATANELISALSDDPLHQEHVELGLELQELQDAFGSHTFQQRQAEETLYHIPHYIQGHVESIEDAQGIYEYVKDVNGIEIKTKGKGDEQDTVEFYDFKTQGGELKKILEERVVRFEKALANIYKQQDRSSKGIAERRSFIGHLGVVTSEDVPYTATEKQVMKDADGKVIKEKGKPKKMEVFVQKTKKVKKFKLLDQKHGREQAGVELKPQFMFTGQGGKNATKWESVLEVRAYGGKVDSSTDGGISRSVTNLQSNLQRFIGEKQQEITDLEGERGELQRTVDTEFDGVEEMREKEERMRVLESLLLEQQEEQSQRIRDRAAARAAGEEEKGITRRGGDDSIQYSISPKVEKVTTTTKVLETIIPILKTWANFPVVRVVQTVEELPKKIRDKVTAQQSMTKGKVEGLYDPDSDQVYLIAGNLAKSRIEAVLRHEGEGHRGLRLLMGDSLNSFLDSVGKAKKADLLKINPDLTFRDQNAVREAANEWLAREIEAGTMKPLWHKKLIAAFRNWLREFIPNLKLTDNDIKAILYDVVMNVREGKAVAAPKATGSDVQFSTAWANKFMGKFIKAIPKARPKVASLYEKFKDDWFKAKDWAFHQNSVEAMQIQVAISEALGQKRVNRQVKEMDMAIHVYLDLKRNPEHFDLYYQDLSDDAKKIADLANTVEDNRGLVAVAEYIDNEYIKIGKKALGTGVIYNTIENYVARTWKLEDGRFSNDKVQKFKTSSRHARQRVFETILEGQAMGFELKVEGASNNLNMLKDEIARTIEDKKLVKEMLATKDEDGKPLVTESRKKEFANYVKIEHPNFTYYGPSHYIKEGEIKTYGAGHLVESKYGAIKFGNKRATMLFDTPTMAEAFISMQPNPGEWRVAARHTVREKKQLYAQKEIAESLNKILGASKLKGVWKIGDTSIIDVITKYNAVIKSWILITSFFHHLAFMRSYMLGTRGKKGRELNPFAAYKDGLKAMEEMGKEIKLLVENGLTLGRMQDWEEATLREEETIFGKALDALGPGGTKVKKSISALREWQADFLFKQFGAGLKAQAALVEYRNALDEHKSMEPDDRAKMVAKLINDDFGGLHHGRMERDQTVQHIFRLMALAPDWTESNIRTMYKAFITGGEEQRALYRRFWASVISKGFAVTLMANMLLSIGDDEDVAEKFKKAWEAGHFRWLDVDITNIYKVMGYETERRKYFSLIGHFKDPAKFLRHPVRSAHHKGSVVYRTFHEAMAGTDWRGQRFTSLDELRGVDDKGIYLTTRRGKYKMGDPKGGKLRGKLTTYKEGSSGPISISQMPSYLIGQARGAMPIPAQNLLGWITGEIEGFDAVSRSAGLHTTSTYPTEKTSLEGFAREYIDIREEGKSLGSLKRRVRKYNKTQRDTDGKTIRWSRVVRKGNRIRRAERKKAA